MIFGPEQIFNISRLIETKSIIYNSHVHSHHPKIPTLTDKKKKKVHVDIQFISKIQNIKIKRVHVKMHFRQN